jgi:hypothetical protein
MYYHHANIQGQTNTPINTQYLPNSSSPPNVLTQPNMQYSPLLQGQSNMQYYSTIQAQQNTPVNTPIPIYANMYPSVNIQGQLLPHMLPNQIAPPVQVPILSVKENKNNYGLSDYSMISGEEEMQNDDEPTDKHPWQKVENKRKRRKRE